MLGDRRWGFRVPGVEAHLPDLLELSIQVLVILPLLEIVHVAQVQGNGMGRHFLPYTRAKHSVLVLDLAEYRLELGSRA